MNTTTAEVEQALRDGSAVLRLIKLDEAWYAAANDIPRDGAEREWSLGVDAVDGGTFGEWSVKFFTFTGGHPAARLDMFDDGVAAFCAVPGLLKAVGACDGDPATLEKALVDLGFVDTTPRVNPYAQEVTS